MIQVQYIKTGLLSNLILILCICATWYSCNDDADQAAAAPEILFMNENLTVDLKKAEYMAGHIGEEFDGVISGVTAFGMFIELENGVEGLVHISSLMDD